MNRAAIARILIIAATALVAMNIISSAAFDHAGGFRIIGKLRMSPSFADLRHLTANAGCDQSIDEIDKGQAKGCDVYGRPGLGYPPLIFHLAREIGVRKEDTGVLGLTIGASFVGIVASQYWRSFTKCGIPGLMIGLGALLGMPTILGLERMNIDIAIFVLLYLLGVTLDWRNKQADPTLPGSIFWAGLVSFASVVISASKIYPGVGLLIWIAAAGWQNIKARYMFYGLLSGTVVGTYIGMKWLLSGGQTPSPGVGLITHSIWLRLGDSPLSKQEALAAIVIFAVTIISSFHFLKEFGRQEPKEGSLDNGFKLSIFAQTAFVSWLACYLTGTSFDYRMVLLIPAMAESYQNMWSYRTAVCKRDEGFWAKYGLELLGATYFCAVLTPLLYFWLDTQIYIVSGTSDYAAQVITNIKSLSFYACRISDIAGIPWIAGTLLAYFAIAIVKRHRLDWSN